LSTPPTPPVGRILIFGPNHPSVNAGGSEHAAYALFCGLRDLGCDVRFLAMCRRSDAHRLVLAGPDEDVVLSDDGEYDGFYHLASPRLKARILAAIDAVQPAVVNFQHYLGIGANTIRDCAALPGLRVVVTLHEYLAICNSEGQLLTRPQKSLCSGASPAACVRCFPNTSPQEFAIRAETIKRNFAGVGAFVAPSQFLADTYVDWGLERGRIERIDNGLLETPRRAALSRDDAAAVFGFFGQITPNKGVDLLVTAVELLADSDFIGSVRIHGPLVGEARETLARLTDRSRLPRNVTYFGAYNNDQIGRLMADCDYVVTPSIWWENDPVVIQEAYAVGRPVICANIGGMAEKVRHGQTGLHFRAGDPVDLARVMLEAQAGRVRSTLQRQVPRPPTRTDMARGYLSLFSRL